MKRFGCYFGLHKQVLVAVNTDYYTTYTDTGFKQHHMMRFYQCEHCGKRHFETNFKKQYTNHNGIDAAKANWVDVGIVPSSSYDPRKGSHTYTPESPKPTTKKDAEVIPFKVMKGGKDE